MWSEMETMQACIYEAYGSADVVRVAEAPSPAPKDDEILVRVRATSVTTADWRFRASAFPPVFWLAGRLLVGLFRPRHPILGMDFSGIVEATGRAVTRFRAGDAVVGAASRGAHAELVAVRESGAIVHKPDAVTHEEAAAIPFGANSALAFLRDFAKVQRGQRVLVIGASGGVGVWAVQIARHFGAEVTGVASAKNAELVRSLGAERVIDYASEPFAQAGDGYDLVFDTVGVTTYGRCRAALAPKGVYLPLNAGLREILQALYTAVTPGRRVRFGISANTRAALEQNLAWVASGATRPVIDHVYPMAKIAAAHAHVESRHRRGSVIVTIP
jgi:NADPH:quinone reductase-like Zn-dependent oxidoreductase